MDIAYRLSGGSGHGQAQANWTTVHASETVVVSSTHRIRRVLALVMDAFVLPACVGGLVLNGFERGLLGVIGAALAFGLLKALRAEEPVVFWGAIAANAVFFWASFPIAPLGVIGLIVGAVAMVASGATPGTFIMVLRTVGVDGADVSLNTQHVRSGLALLQASFAVWLTGSVAALVAVRAGGDLIGLLAGGAVLVGAVIAAAAVPRGLVDQMLGTRLTYTRSPQLPPARMNPYASALWGSTVGLDLDFTPPEQPFVEEEDV